MDKLTFKIKTYTQHVKGYGIFDYTDPVTEQRTLDCIVKNLPKKKKYIHHVLRTEFVAKPKYGTHPVADGFDKPPIQIPKGDLIYYVDVYCEDR
jgi:hypothetical protein